VYDTVGRPRYEIKMERPHHDHLVCVDCGVIQEVQWPEIEKGAGARVPPPWVLCPCATATRSSAAARPAPPKPDFFVFVLKFYFN
jgi:hypothetical protein